MYWSLKDWWSKKYVHEISTYQRNFENPCKYLMMKICDTLTLAAQFLKSFITNFTDRDICQ